MSADGQAAAGGESAELPSVYSVAIEGSANFQVGDHNIQNIYNYGPGTRASRDARQPIPGSPYRGLSAFEEQDHHFFCGRDEAVNQLMDRLSACARPGGGDARGILVVSGASGAGKSSLLRAGVLPRLRSAGVTGAPGSESWPCLLFTPGDAPLSELAAQVATMAGIRGDEARQDLRADPAGFRALARQAVLAARHRQNRGPDAGDRLLLIIDQFEQLLTVCPSEEERRDFVAALCGAASAAEPPALVIIGVRADFEARCADEYPELAPAIQDRFLLTAMPERSLQLAITEPARRAGAHVEQELASRLMDEIRARRPATIAAAGTGSATRASAGVLPLLSYALAETWRVHSGDTMTLRDYDMTGGIGAAVEKAAERAYGTLGKPRQYTARQVFLQLAATSADGTDTSAPVTRADLDAGKDPRDVQAVLDAFAAERLLTLTSDGAEISHEALLTAWPLLRDTWLGQTRADRVVRTRLRDAASEWASRAKDPSYLWSGTLLASASATDGASVRLPPLTLGEREFLAASQGATRRRTRRRRAGVAIVCVLALVAAAVGAYSLREEQDAAQHAATVHSTQLAADAQALQAADPGLAAQLAVAAYRFAPTEQAVTQMYSSLDTPLDTVIGTAGSDVLGVATEAHGPLAAAIGQDGTLRVWNLSNPSSPVLDATIQAGATAIALSPDGRLLAGGCPLSRGVCLWDLADPGHPVLTGRWLTPSGDKGKGSFASMSISPDGKLLAAVPASGSTLVWSISDPSRPRLVTSLPDPGSQGRTLTGVAFAPHGAILAETTPGGAIRLWSTASPARPVLLTTIKGGYSRIAFSPAGSMLAAVGDNNIGLWQIGDPRHPKVLDLHGLFPPSPDTTAVAFSPDGDNLAITEPDSFDTRSELCTLRIPAEILNLAITGPTCTSTAFQSEAASYTSGGALLTGGSGGQVRLWRWPVLPAEGDLTFGVEPQQFSPDGRLMASPAGLPQQGIDIWGLTGSTGPVLDATIPVASDSTALFLSASVLLISGENGEVQLWDLRDPRHPSPGASLGTAGILKVPFAVGGSTIGGETANNIVSVEGPDGQLHLWHITSPTRAIQVGTIPGTLGFTGLMPDGQTAIRFTGHSIQWWDISDPAHPVRRSISALPGSLYLSVSDGTFLAVTTADQAGDLATADLTLFNVTRGQVRSSTLLSKATGTVLNASPDNRLLAISGSGEDAVTLWDTSNPAHPRRLDTISTLSGVSDIEFSPDSKELAVATGPPQGATAQLWDISDPGDPVALGSMTWLPGGDATSGIAASTSLDGLTFTGSGDDLAIEMDGETYVFDTDPAELAAHLCADAGAAISPAQWQQYAPDVPYQRPCP